MNLKTESITKGETRKELKKQVVVTVCGTAFALAALAGIGAWQTKAHDATSKPVAPSAYRATVTRARPAQYPTYYLVASQQQADWWLRKMESDPDVDLSRHVFVVVSSPKDEARARQAVDEGQIAAESGDRPGPKLVDLRTP